MNITTRTKAWGNSIGIVIPSESIQRLKIKADEEVIISIQKKENVLKELFGTLKTKKTTEQIIKEGREDLESKWSK
ncbi:MAG: hypothetical protein WCK90_02620 [archaeon]